MKKTFKYRLSPTKIQRTRLNETLESCRWIYNRTLETRKNAWEQEKKNISFYDSIKMIPLWRVENPEIKNVYAQTLQGVCGRVDFAFQGFFRRVRNGEKPGYPRFKGFGRYDSFTYPQVESGFRVVENKIRLPKIGRVKIKLHRPIEGKIKTITIGKDPLGNWYGCFSCEVEQKLLPSSIEVVGIDLGLTTFATFSTGKTIERKRWMKEDEKDLKRIQRKIEKLGKETPERRKAIKALNHVHTRIKNRRNNFAHQESRKLVNRFGLIVFEDLDIDGMQANGNKVINRGIADVAWGMMMNFSQYKAVDAGRGYLKINPKRTTQDCSGCGVYVFKDLSVRIHDCPNCGLKIDRDLNAALNILARGLASLQSELIEAFFEKGRNSHGIQITYQTVGKVINREIWREP